MTAAVLVASAGGHARRRPLVSHADLIRAIADLAPDDPERAREIAVLLGLRSAPARAVEGPAEPPSLPPEPPGTPPSFPTDSEHPAAGDQAPAEAVPATLIPLAMETQVTEDVQWLHAVGPLDQRPPGTARAALPVEPLFEPRWTVGIVSPRSPRTSLDGPMSLALWPCWHAGARSTGCPHIPGHRCGAGHRC
jgi:hypothetical protein